jgi:hypothetical protein
MSMVHASSGKLRPASEQLRSEPAILACMAHATLPNSKLPWLDLIADYDRITVVASILGSKKLAV